MKKVLIIIISLIALLLISAFIIFKNLVGDLNQFSSQSSSEISKSSNRGIALVLQGSSGVSFLDFMNIVKNSSNIKYVSWVGSVEELSKVNSTPYSLTKSAKEYNFIPVVIVAFHHSEKYSLIKPFTKENTANLKKDLLNFVGTQKPAYLGLGNEINIMYENNKNDFDNFVNFYNEIYPEIKKTSPETKVFSVFQYEKLKGLNGGLYGKKNDETKNEWSIVDKFKSLDLIGYTLYPSIIYKKPSLIPPKYFEDLKHNEKEFLVSETGWPTNSKIKGWESNEKDAQDYIDTLNQKLSQFKPEIIIWSFLYDPKGVSEIFTTMGLNESKDKAKSIYELWK